jgi:hypothetical protein
MSRTEKTTLARRDFFRMASLGAGAVGVAAVAVKTTGASAAEPPDDRLRKTGYRETEHVRKFYDLARF